MDRVLYLAVSKAFGEIVLPDRPASEADWPEEKLLDARRWARYYFVSNALMALVYVLPLFIAIEAGAIVPALYALILILLHLVFVVVEKYKMGLYDRHLRVAKPGGGIMPIKIPSGKRLKRLPFETAKFYRALGIELFRSLTLKYTDWARLRPSERTGAQRVIYTRPDPRELQRFAEDSVVSEWMHIVGFCLNCTLLVLLLPHNLVLAQGYVGLVMVLDLACVLLQRYNRSRILDVAARRSARPKNTTQD